VASDSQEKPAPYVPCQEPSNFAYKRYQSKKDIHAEKEYLKQMSELANIVQQQRLENKKLEKLFLDSKNKLLQLSLALNQKQEITPADPWDKFVATVMMLLG
jgi:hypothetical protein